MDPRLHFPTHQNKLTSLYGFDLTQYVQGDGFGRGRGYEAAVRALTHGGIQPLDQAVKGLGLYDRAALAVLSAHAEVEARSSIDPDRAATTLALYVNTLGRLHIRPASLPRIVYAEGDRNVEVGYLPVTDAVLAEIDAAHEVLRRDEADAFAEVRAAMDRVYRDGSLATVLEEVIDHVEHVESVGFYVADRFLALIDRYVNLIDGKAGQGYLPALREKPYDEWTDEEVLVVAGLHALFQSGRAVRFEEFNGAALTARALVDRLGEISDAYVAAGCEVAMPPGLDLFDRSRVIMQQALCAVGKPWLRYRWIYGLSFLKTERILPSTASTEREDAWLDEFGADYDELVSDHSEFVRSEHVGMAALAHACVARDVAGVRCDRGSDAVTNWVEYLMEKVVASAVRATNADYGMSSSLRDLNRLVSYEEAALVDEIHALTPNHFFTCFVSNDMVSRLGADEAGVIATSVQKRMMFNRWHFIPGNLERPLVRKSRHWYYPPLIPDIAVHSDMHRAAHNRARVKYSIRCPGPDMSRPALFIGNERYRGFYDIRVVRMEGEEFTVEDVLRARRRTLWLEAVYAALAQNAMRPGRVPLAVAGFQPGAYFDIPAAALTPVLGGFPAVHLAADAHD
ncbi:hypothetical protein [Arenibaculum sp.]|uniref:hypothetical protein n=1 Tax=Arenibaculum sp. TaxID=2865862 RepID=UPI002E124E60|nr:hypothetical protein [Arenibaculum sp.]